jgi:hypothetical protein
MNYWNFPSVIGGNINSINNAGIETFRDNPIESLAREIIQNTLDAVKDPNQPVRVEFSKFSTSVLPNKNNLIDAYMNAENTWQNKNTKSVDFIKKALQILDNEKIDYLRISDFNTSGLIGAKDARLGSPWSSLIKESGSSNKDDNSGGSFGIGKAAPFLNSDLRTIFYSSYDIEGYKSHIGVADIMSFRKENNEITIGKGYYTNNVVSNAIEGLLNLDPSFERNECGTDIYISAFNRINNWKDSLIQSILSNFFITIYNKILVVKIDDFEINHSNLNELIVKLDDNEENREIKNYYNVITSNQTIRFPYPHKSYSNSIAFNEGEAELLIIDGNDLNRKVLMTRKTGMKIFEQNKISGSISFTGVLMMKGININKIFKQMENPSHNSWQPNRYEDNPKLADRIFSDLRKFIREKVKEAYQQPTTDTMNAVGLSDFLPNKNLLNGSGQETTETIHTRIKDIITKKFEQRKMKKLKSVGKDISETLEQVLGEFGISDGEHGGNGDGSAALGGSTGGGVLDPDGDKRLDKNKKGTKDLIEKVIKKSKPITSKQKYICANKQHGHYKFSIVSDIQ